MNYINKINIKSVPSVMSYCWPEFIEKEGCVFIKDQVPDKIEIDSSNPDRTSIESFYSHTHILDLFENKAEFSREPFYRFKHKDFKIACEIGKLFAQTWFQKLLLDFPKYHFRVYYTEKDNPIVRFHRVRKSEPFWVIEKDWKIEIEKKEIIILDSLKAKRTNLKRH